MEIVKNDAGMKRETETRRRKKKHILLKTAIIERMLTNIHSHDMPDNV